MDNYDERMNYSFEPQPEPAAPQHEPQRHEPKKAKGKTGRLIALVVAVALVAGIGGSVLTDVIGKISERNAETRAAMAEAPARKNSMASSPVMMPPMPITGIFTEREAS